MSFISTHDLSHFRSQNHQASPTFPSVCHLIFEMSPIYKLFVTQQYKLLKQALPANAIQIPIPQINQPDAIQFEVSCSKCGAKYRIGGKFSPLLKLDEKFKEEGFIPFPKEAKIRCACGNEIDLSGVKADIETKAGKKLILE